jgi:hypothetical protein
MSLSTLTTKVSYTVVSLTQTMTVTFPFQVDSDVTASDGALVLVQGSDYTITGGGYDSSNDMQTGSITLTGTGSTTITLGDTITIYRSTIPNQETSFTSTGIQTPLMIESDDDKLTMLAQQALAEQYFPFPPVSGTQNIIALGWITADSGGIPTSIDSLNIVNVPTNQLPLFIAVSISDDLEVWKLRAMQVGDPSVTTLPNFVVPVTNPNSLIWVRVNPAGVPSGKVASGSVTINFGTVNAGVRALNSQSIYTGVQAGNVIVFSLSGSVTNPTGIVFLQPNAPSANTIDFYAYNPTSGNIVVGSVTFNWIALAIS